MRDPDGTPNQSRDAVSCRLAPRVAMVQTTQAQMRNHRRLGCRCVLRSTGRRIRRILFQGIVNPVVVIVAHVVADQSAEVLFVPGDDMVQDLGGAEHFPPIFRRSRFATAPGRSSVLVPDPSPSKTPSRQHRFSSRGRGSRIDTGKLRETLRAVAGRPNPPSGAGSLACRILLRPCSMTKKQYSAGTSSGVAR